MTNYCHRCFRELATDDFRCSRCTQQDARPASKIILLLGLAGVPLLAAGILGYDRRLSLVGGVISGVAVVLSIIASLR